MSNPSWGSWLVALATAILLHCAQHPLLADTHEWRGAGTGGNTATDPSNPTTLWNTASNWSPGAVPASGDTVWLRLTNSGYVNAQDASINQLRVDGSNNGAAFHIGNNVALGFTTSYNSVFGFDAVGHAIQTGGIHTVNNYLYLGQNTESAGSYSLLNGELSVTSHEYIGSSGTGAFTQSGGTHSVGRLYLGDYTGASGSYTLSDGELTVKSDESIGYNGTGTFDQSGGTHTVKGDLYLGKLTGSGIYTLSNGQLTTNAQEFIGGIDSGSGAFTQSGGTHTVTKTLYVSSKGTYLLNSGSLIADALSISGRFETLGGTVAIANSLTVSGLGTLKLESTDLSVKSLSVQGLLAFTNGTLRANSVSLSSSSSPFLLHSGSLIADSLSTYAPFEVRGGTLDVASSLAVSSEFWLNDCNATMLAHGTVSPDGALKIDSGVLSLSTLQMEGLLALSNGTVRASGISLLGTKGARIMGSGTLAGAVAGDGFSQITASGGDLVLGDATSWSGFRTAGTIVAGVHSITLDSRTFAGLGSLTTLDRGIIRAPNGVFVPGASNVVGTGQINARIFAEGGSTIAATGPLALGDAGALDGFYSDGVLAVGANTVTINDRNEGVLGSLTTLGEGGVGGTLMAGNARAADSYAHFLLAAGKNVAGRGQIDGNFKNNGNAVGDGPAAGERLVFNSPWTVSGSGTFTNTMVMGTFAPGEGIGVATGRNQGFAGLVQIELGGAVQDDSRGLHDQVIDSGTMRLEGSPRLSIQSWKGFLPTPGDEFEILAWQEGLQGIFCGVNVDPWFSAHGVSFALVYQNPESAGRLALAAIPKPPSLTWTGGGDDDRWTTIANWGGTIPVANVQLQFGAGGGTSYNDFPVGAEVQEIAFSSDAPAYRLEGNAIKLSGEVVNHSGNDQTISLDMELAGDSEFDSGGKTLTLEGTLSGTGPLVKDGAGTLVLSSVNNYAGGTVVTAGVLEVAGPNALPAGGPLTIQAGGTVMLGGGLEAAIVTIAVPEPSTFALLGVGVLGVLAAWRRHCARFKS